MIKKTKKHFRKMNRKNVKQNTRRKRNKSRIQKKKGGSRRDYSPEDTNLFLDYISDMPDNDKKEWLMQNINRMPYEENYDFNFPPTTPPPDFDTNPYYYQGIDRIQGYLHGYDTW